jgi:sulfoacetaldehyde dehydrogenase
MLMVEEDKTGEESPFSGEKMSLVLTLYKSNGIEDAIRITNENHAYSGSGHSCGIYSQTLENIEKYALETYTTRVVVNQPQAATNGGSWTSGMPFTHSLGCGTWGGNICSENIEMKHYLNNTWVIREIPNFKPSDEELFSGFVPRK